MGRMVAIVIGLFSAGSAFGQELERDVTELHQPLADVLSRPPQPGVISIIGGLKVDEVGRIARRHWNELAYCYEAYGSYGDVYDGHVEVVFTIDAVGDVPAARLVSDMNNGALESCLRSNVVRWKFPPPRGGGVVEVHYPLAFESETKTFPSAPLLHPAIRQDLAQCAHYYEPERLVLGIRLGRAGDVMQFRVAEPTWLPRPMVDCLRKNVAGGRSLWISHVTAARSRSRSPSRSAPRTRSSSPSRSPSFAASSQPATTPPPTSSTDSVPI